MNSKHFARLGLATALALVMAPSAFAAGTDAGTNITNTATVNYDVGGVPQPPVNNPTPDDFEVDRRILFTVAATDGAESVAPGAQNQALTYVIQNDTNDTVDFYLSVEELTGDDFDGVDGGSAAQFYLDDGDGIFNGADTLLPTSPLGKPYLASVPEYNGVAGNLRVVHVVYDIDTGLANGDTAEVYLVADFFFIDWAYTEIYSAFRAMAEADSITIDPHKMGMATIPGGGLLFRHPEDLERLAAYAPYLTVARPKALTGTRSGAAAAAIWAVMNRLGREGFKKVVDGCMGLSRRMVEGAKQIGIEPVMDPVMNVVTLRMDDPEGVRASLLDRRWRVSTTRSPKALRLIIMPHSTAENVDLFLADLEDLLRKRA